MRRMLHRNIVAGVLTLLLGAGLFGTAAPIASATSAAGAVSAPSKVSTAKRYNKKSKTYKKYRSYKKYKKSYKRYYKKSYTRYYKKSYKRYYKKTSKKTVRTNLRTTGGNRYYAGYCTWYAYERRKAMGRPVGGFWGNAKAWAGNARGAGFSVNRTPRVGAVLVKTSGAWGHVAVVERVNPNGSIVVSEMNVAGFNRVSNRTFTKAQAAQYQYIH